MSSKNDDIKQIEQFVLFYTWILSESAEQRHEQNVKQMFNRIFLVIVVHAVTCRAFVFG